MLRRALDAIGYGNTVTTDGPLATLSFDADGRFDSKKIAYHAADLRFEDEDGRIGGAGVGPDGGRTATIESKTNCFAAVPKGDTGHAVCMPLHRCRTTIVLETRITRGDGKLAAIVTQTQLIFDNNDASE